MTPTHRLLLLGLIACLISTILLAILFRLRMSPAEKERRRRIRLNLMGRITDGLLTDVHGSTLYYTYSVHGVSYNTSQDISFLRDLVPEDAALIIGPVALKYLARNPGNSIVICERWSGLRIRGKTANSPAELPIVRG